MYLCTPALVYLVFMILSIIGCIFLKTTDGLVLNTVFSLGWLWLLQVLCSRGYVTLAWVLVLLPLIIGLILVVIIIGVIGSVSTAAVNTTADAVVATGGTAPVVESETK